jgi:SAM-dependent methyltransferase
MSLGYKLLYALGFTPWEEIAELSHVREQFSALLDREEAGRKPPSGPVLDLGCGGGIWAVELARRGWQVTGVDNVPKALRRARDRASQAGVEIRLVEGDVVRLSATDVGSGFPFLLDLGLFHDELTDRQRGDGPRGDRRRSIRGDAADGRVGAREARAAAARREPATTSRRPIPSGG